MICAILPVKSPKNAKRRLGDFLGPAERELLARRLFKQTFEALRKASGIDRIVVVTNDSEVAEHARNSGAGVFEEDEQVSHSVSADAACLKVQRMGASTALLVPIDVPLATPEDFSRLAAAASHGLVIVPSMDGTGTNALVRTPPDVIESRFGPGSCQAHLDQAKANGVQAQVLKLEGLMFDIDTPEDIAQLLLRAPDAEISEFLRTVCVSR